MRSIVNLLIRLCNLRIFLVCLGVMVACGMPMPSTLSKFAVIIDQNLLRLGVDVNELPTPVTDVTVIHVPDLEYDSWLADLAGAKGLYDLLTFIQSQPDQPVMTGIVLEQPFSLIQSQAESILKQVIENKSSRNKPVNDQINTLLDRRGQLLALLESPNVVLGIQNAVPVGQVPIETVYRAPSYAPEWLMSFMKTLSRNVWPFGGDERLVSINPRPVIPHYPIVPDDDHLSYLLLRGAESQMTSGFVIEFLRAAYLTTAEVSSDATEESQTPLRSPPLSWQRGDSLQLNSKAVHLSFDGSIVPIYSEFSGIRTALKQVTLASALRSENLSGWIVIGRDQSPELQQIAQTLASVGDDAYLHKTVWFPLINGAWVLFSLVFFVWVMPRLRLITASVFCVLAIVGLAIAQVLAHLLYSWWWPVSVLMIWTVMAYLIMLVWMKKNEHYRRLSERADEADCRYAIALMEKARFERALDYLLACGPSHQVLETLYVLGSRCDEHQHWALSRDAFSELKKRSRRFRDVALRLKEVNEKLKTAETEQSEAEGSDAEVSLSQTVALDMASAPQSLVQSVEGRTLGRYELQKEIGRGAMGTVYLGFDPKIARNVAVKTLDYQQFSSGNLEESKTRFFKEAEAAGRLTHAHIVQVFDVGEEKDLAYIAMDFANGVPLNEFIHEDNLLPPFKVYKIIADVADALDYAHNQNIVHRDIKPSNIIVDPDTCAVKVTDFGIARLVDNSQTRTGEILGSPLYMAPEQLKGQKVNYAADIFSLGVTFYQLLSGRLPFKGESLASLTYDVIHAKHASVRSIRPDLPFSASRISNKAMNKNISDRYPNAGVMSRALRKALKRDFSSEAKAAGFVE